MINVVSAWRAVTAMFILNGALFGIWASRIPAVRDHLQLSHEALGYGLLFMAAGAVCSFPITGRLTDRFGAVAITRVIAVLYTGSLVLLGLADSFTLLAVFLFVFGAFHGSMDVAMNAWAAEVESAYEKPLMSSFHAMWSLGAGLGAISGYAAVQMQMSVLQHFLAAGGLVVALALALSWVQWTSRRSVQSQGSVFAFPSGALILVGFTALCGALGEGAVADWSAIFLRDVTGAAESVATLGYAVFSVAMVVCRLAGGGGDCPGRAGFCGTGRRDVCRYGRVLCCLGRGCSAGFGGLYADGRGLCGDYAIGVQPGRQRSADTSGAGYRKRGDAWLWRSADWPAFDWIFGRVADAENGLWCLIAACRSDRRVCRRA
ncbi:MFS transporter [Ruegeria sp. SCPT10]|uniref:MFS transporter n=1 Tax=Ruegeria sp. SCP10 TaxID=3141377 RepID=UPI00333D2F7E